MTTKIVISADKMQQHQSETQIWLAANAGIGSARFGGREGDINHWLNGDDWCWYNQYAIADLEESSTVFLFKSSKIATEFALRFA